MTWRIIIMMEASSDLLAPKHAKSKTMYIVKKFELEKLYGNIVKHIDCVFDRWYCPVHQQYEPCYDGWRLKSFINDVCKIRGLKSTQAEFYGIFGEVTVLVTKKITKENGETLVNFEAFPAGSRLHAVVDIYDEDVLRMLIERLEKLKEREVKMKGKRSRGYGRVRVLGYMLNRLNSRT